MSRKYESGSQKRKTAQDKVERQNSLLKQIPKLTSYFNACPGKDEDADNGEGERESLPLTGDILAGWQQ